MKGMTKLNIKMKHKIIENILHKNNGKERQSIIFQMPTVINEINDHVFSNIESYINKHFLKIF